MCIRDRSNFACVLKEKLLEMRSLSIIVMFLACVLAQVRSRSRSFNKNKQVKQSAVTFNRFRVLFINLGSIVCSRTAVSFNVC